MKAEVEFIKRNNKVKMAVTFNTSSLGCFTVDTAYMSAAEVYERYERLYDEISPFGNISLNPNGIIIRDENG
ncbi:MAG: hypothetical protein OSJ43_15955 [Oscillospiraceae bacterium]|nr:hypothetical protein [Oscillospiraceae bacterium]